MFGYGIIASDTCVTIKNPDTGKIATVDAVQKAFPLGPFVIGGFAGSIYIGFELISSLRSFLRIPESEDNCAWYLDWVVENWKQTAKKIFEGAPQSERDSHSHIILVAAHPTEDVGIPGLARIHIAVLKSPNFEPVVHVGEFFSIDSIGSGASYYMDQLVTIREKGSNLAQMETAFQGGMGAQIQNQISDCLRTSPLGGVSPHLHILTVRRGGYSMRNNDYLKFAPDGTESKFEMPVFADNYAELMKLLKVKGVVVAGSQITA